MYHDIVELGDKVAIIMDKSDLPLLIFLLGKQVGSDSSKTKLLANGYRKLVTTWAGETYYSKFDFVTTDDKHGWSLKEKA